MLSPSQVANVLSTLHNARISERLDLLKKEMLFFNLNPDDLLLETANVQTQFKNGIEKLNPTQLGNLIQILEEEGEAGLNKVKDKLRYYEVEDTYKENIVVYLRSYINSGKPISDVDLYQNFKGIQVATRDSFNKLLSQGFTGNWDFNPDNVIEMKLCIASMNDTGAYPRGYVILADIDRFEMNENGRYLIYFSHPQIFNTGNRNVKFSQQAVRYFNSTKA